MSAILMWHVGQDVGTPLNEDEAQATLEPLRQDGQNAELQHAPEWNELDTDNSGQLIGLSPRVVGSDTTDTVKYAPWWATLADTNHNAIIDNQVSSSGTAAARELAGQQGHGTMQYEIGIEPVIRPGAAYGNDYFTTNPSIIQEGAGNYMNPVGDDQWAAQVSQRDASLNSRSAYNDSMYAAFLGG